MQALDSGSPFVFFYGLRRKKNRRTKKSLPIKKAGIKLMSPRFVVQERAGKRSLELTGKEEEEKIVHNCGKIMQYRFWKLWAHVKHSLQVPVPLALLIYT